MLGKFLIALSGQWYLGHLHGAGSHVNLTNLQETSALLELEKGSYTGETKMALVAFADTKPHSI